ncbi:MAG: hypothetical protein ABIF88_00615 [archaeon]
MRFRRAFGIGILIGVSVFVLWLAMINLSVIKSLVWLQWMLYYLLLIPLVIYGARLYYKSGEKTCGFCLGFIFIFCGFIFDILILTLIVFGDYHFIKNPLLWVGYLEILVITKIYYKFKIEK